MDDNNTVDGKPVYFFREEDGITLDGVPIGQLIAVNCQGLHASNLSFTNVFDGIYAAISDDLRIENCTFSSVGNVGINLEYCVNVTLFRNDLRDFDVYGTCMDFCSGIVATYNTFTRSDSSYHGQGVLLYHSSSAEMYANRMVKILDGIMAWDCTDVDIRHNAMINIYWSGVQLADSDNVRITENLITLCTQTSSYSDSALEIYRSSQIKVVNNSLVDNVAQVTVSDSESIIWNGSYPMGGNYWSNYTGIDVMSGPDQTLSGSDGFGDFPYAIDSSNNDHYPLMVSGIKNLPPIAFFTSGSISGNTSTVFTVDSSGSWDFENWSDGLSFRWDWEGDGVCDTDWSANNTWNHTYSNGGNFTMRLEVRDGEGATGVYSVLIRVAEPLQEDVPGKHGIDIIVVAAIAGIIVAAVLVALLLFLRKKNPPGATTP
jgi:parallel beta-helix repeat protein